MKIMKTKNRTLIAICALGIIGLMNINAISDNKKEVVNDKAEVLAIKSEMTDEAIIYSARAFSTVDIENEIEEYATNQILPLENALTNEVIYSAKSFSDLDFENEIKNINQE